TAVNPFKKFSTRMKTPAPLIWPSIRQIRERYTPRCGPRALHLGKFEVVLRFTSQVVDYSNPPMAATLGGILRKVYRQLQMNSAALESLSRLQNPIAFTPLLKQRAPWAASIAPTTPVNPGKKQTTITASAAAARAQWVLPSRQTTPTRFMSPTPRL